MASPRAVVRVLAATATAAGMVVLSSGPASADNGLLEIVQEVTGTVQNVDHDATGTVQNAERDVMGTVQNIVFDVTGTVRAVACRGCS